MLQDVFQCDTLGELLTLVEGCPLDAADDLPAPSYGPGESRAVWFTPGQVGDRGLKGIRADSAEGPTWLWVKTLYPW